MSELLKNFTVKVVGVSFQNDDGTDRQEIISGLSVGEAMLLEYFEYDNEPAYAITDALGNRIGSLPKDLASDIYQKYRDCYFAAMVDDILGGHDGYKYGCVVRIYIYDTAPDFVVADSAAPKYSDKTYNVCGTLLIILGILLALLGLLLLLVSPVAGIIAILIGVLAFFSGRKYKNIVKVHRESAEVIS